MSDEARELEIELVRHLTNAKLIIIKARMLRYSVDISVDDWLNSRAMEPLRIGGLIRKL